VFYRVGVVDKGNQFLKKVMKKGGAEALLARTKWRSARRLIPEGGFAPFLGQTAVGRSQRRHEEDGKEKLKKVVRKAQKEGERQFMAEPRVRRSIKRVEKNKTVDKSRHCGKLG